MQSMDPTERQELVDLIAQAVIDKIDERERINRLADMVVARVLSLQEQEAKLKTGEGENHVT